MTWPSFHLDWLIFSIKAEDHFLCIRTWNIWVIFISCFKVAGARAVMAFLQCLGIFCINFKRVSVVIFFYTSSRTLCSWCTLFHSIRESVNSDLTFCIAQSRLSQVSFGSGKLLWQTRERGDAVQGIFFFQIKILQCLRKCLGFLSHCIMNPFPIKHFPEHTPWWLMIVCTPLFS